MIAILASISLPGEVVLAQAVRSLEPGAIVELFELDLSTYGGPLLRFHAGTNNLLANVTWAGNVYSAFPVQVSGFEFNGQGQSPRPTLAVSNIAGAVTALILQYSDLVGARVTRIRTLSKYLDAVNFPGGVNPSADPAAEFPRDIYYIDRKAAENVETVEFELAAAMDVTGVMLPRRQIVQNVCPWKYRGAECSYSGAAYFDSNDVPTGLGGDVCGKRMSSCQARFGAYAELPFGGFPAAGLFR